jgi:phosphoesterase RecJ-like protein
MNVKDTVKKLSDKIKDSEVVKGITDKIKSTGAVDAVINTFKNDDYYDIKKQIFKKIKEYNTIVIHRHVHPDGDCTGSSFGLRDILRTSFPDKRIYSVGEDNVKYLEFLGNYDVISEETYQDALVIVVDTSNVSRISGEQYKLGKEVIKIDHHIETDKYGAINYVRENFPSTSTIIMDFFETFKNELSMTSEGAKDLYLATVTDTGRFRYSSVNGDTLRLAGSMLDYGFDTDKMYAHLQIKDKESLKLQGYLLNNFETSPNGVSYIYLSKKIQKKYKVSTDEASALVNSMDSIRGSLIWILFIEFDDVIRARLRARFTTVIEIANQFNGGGHLQACGATVKNKKDIKKMVGIADEQLRKYKLENKELF